MVDTCQYIDLAIIDVQQKVVLQHWGRERVLKLLTVKT